MTKSDILKPTFEIGKNVLEHINYYVHQQGMSYIDAILHHSEQTNLEIEVIAEIVKANPKMRMEVEIEAEDLNFLKKTDRLDI